MVDSRTPGDRGDADQELVHRNQAQEVVTSSGGVVQQDVGVVESIDRVEARASSADWLSRLIGLAIGLLEILLGLRIVLKLIAANPDSGFTRFIYGASNVFVAPFNNIVGTPESNSGNVFDVSALIAMAVYLLAAWIVWKVLDLLLNRPASGVAVSKTVDQRNIR